jgi:hypothetical protein
LIIESKVSNRKSQLSNDWYNPMVNRIQWIKESFRWY